MGGLTENEINIDLKDGDLLTISAERKSERGHRDQGFYERSLGAFARSIRLGDAAQTEGLQARLEHGVLQITVPKEQPATPQLDGSRSVRATTSPTAKTPQ